MMKKLLFLCLMMALVVAGCDRGAKHPQPKAAADTLSVAVSADLVDLLSDSIAQDETRSDLFLVRAKAYLEKESVGAAMMDVNRAIELDPKNVDAFLLLSDIYYQLGDQSNITATLNRALEVAPYDSRPMVKLAEINLLQQHYDLSLGFIGNALKISTYNPQAYFVRGMVYMAKQDTATALKNFLIAREQDANYYEPQHELNKIYLAQHNPMAEDFLRSTVNRFPHEEISRYELALFLQDHDAPEEALLHYDTLLMNHPDNSRLLFNKGYVYFVYLGDNQKALDYFSRSLEIDPNYLDALYNKGHVLEQMGDYVQAQDIYQEVLKRKPNYSLALDAVNRIANQIE